MIQRVDIKIWGKENYLVDDAGHTHMVKRKKNLSKSLNHTKQK